MSATYQQSSVTTPEKLKLDPRNRLFSRGARYRLSAEQIRDYALQVSGLLSAKMFGPPVQPPQPKSGLSAAFGGSLDWEPSKGEDRFRRAIYTLWRRTNPYPSFMALDATDRKTCTVRRINTNTPVAAFVTMNDPAFIEAHVATALRITNQNVPDNEKTIFAYSLIVGRQPTEREIQVVTQLLESQLKFYRSNLEEAKKLLAAYTDLPKLSDSQSVDAAAWTIVTNTLLNLDEVLTRN